MPEYDENVLVQAAEELYAEAGRIVFSTAALWMLIGLIVGFGGASVIASSTHDPNYPTGGIGIGLGILALLIGIVIGKRRAFHLRLEAQRTMVQVQIERNTRPPAPTP